MIETRLAAITWHLCDKPLGHWDRYGKETENELPKI